jgi:site-specific DNA-cytosine methylase
MAKKKLTALGAYIFAGGFGLGVREHFQILGHLEDGPFGAETARLNLGIDVHEDPTTWPVEQYDGVNLLYANPPCAPWSTAGGRVNRPHWRKDPRSSCWLRTADLVWQLRPDVAMIESVRPLYTKGRELLAEIAERGRDEGYQAIALLERAMDCGVPQKRERLVFVLSRYEYQATPTGYGDPPTVDEVLKQVKRLRLSKRYHRTPHLPKHMVEVIHAMEPGMNAQQAFDRLHPNPKRDIRGRVINRPGFLQRRLHPGKLCPTMTGSCCLVHPHEARYLSVAENAAMCGFPPDYEFVEKHGDAYAQLAKGVMPPVAEHLAKDAAATIRKRRAPKSLDPLEITIWRDHVDMKEIDL